MREIALLIIGVTLVACANTRQERAAAFQREAPQLVASCNEAFNGAGPRTGFAACRRLAANNSLDLVDPAAASAYVRLNAMADAGGSSPGATNSTPSIGPGGVPQ
jgi:hypothetical protein